MIGTLLFVVFIALMLAGAPIAVALGIGGIAAIAAANADAPSADRGDPAPTEAPL